MAKYSATFSVAGVNSTGNVLINLKTGTVRANVLELGVFMEGASSSALLLLLQRMTAVGTGTITSVNGQPHDAADATSTAVLETAWTTTKPTVSSNQIRRVQLTSALGSGFIWDFTSRPITLAASDGLALVQSNATGTGLGVIGGYIVWEE